MMHTPNTAYIVGVALGDGNLSNPNGRAVRLRITCDKKYPKVIENILISLRVGLPDNKVSLVYRNARCLDISCYSNKLENLLGWRADLGSKYLQRVHVPSWIFRDPWLIRPCVRGLIETDGCVFTDRGYTHVNFTTIIPELATDMERMLTILGFTYSTQLIIAKSSNRKPKYVIRICKRGKEFVDEFGIDKN